MSAVFDASVLPGLPHPGGSNRQSGFVLWFAAHVPAQPGRAEGDRRGRTSVPAPSLSLHWFGWDSCHFERLLYGHTVLAWVSADVLANRQMLLLPPGIREKCVDSLVFETMIPKPMMLHYISLLLKHKRLVLSGPSGTGKTHLAHRLARYLLERSRTDSAEVDHESCVLGRGGAVTFNMHHQSPKVRPFTRRNYLSRGFQGAILPWLDGRHDLVAPPFDGLWWSCFTAKMEFSFFFYRSCSCIFLTWPTKLTEKAEESCL